MKQRLIAAGLLGAVLGAAPAHAVFLDAEHSIQFTGKVYTQASLRTEDSASGGISCYPFGAACEGFTFPDTRTGQLIQHRNLLDVELFHDVGKWLGPQFTLLDQLDYRLRVKYFYDGVYDYGPHQYRNPTSALDATSVPPLSRILYDGLRNARHHDTQHDPLWNAYIDAGRGRFKVRIGRQDLSWGESDGFRLLDMIEPLDNRFGFPLVEDLDDRRIPLWMVRPSISLGRVGPVSNLTLDGYWVPGTIDNQIAPVANFGNPFAVPNPPGPSDLMRPSKNLGNSRGGGRLIGTVGGATLSIAHYVTFNDVPAISLKVNSVDYIPIGAPGSIPNFVYFSPNGLFLVDFYQQQITGGSATFPLPFDPYTIMRMETAFFWDEKVFIPNQSVNLAVPRCGVQAGPCPSPGIGAQPSKDVLRWLIAADRNVWIRWLNPENTFYFSGQYFHTNIFNYQQGIANAVPSHTQLVTVGQSPIPGTGISVPVNANTFSWVPRRADEITLTYLVNTLVWHGTIQPQVFGLYDFRGVHSIVPSISYQYGTNLVFTMKYAYTTGTFANLGFFRDRDQLLFRVQYNLS